MFGGAGLFVDGTMFGLVAGGLIHLKADPSTALDFEREGSVPFSYQTKAGTRSIMSYWRLPERLYDDPDELAGWARAALNIALQSSAPKSKARKAPAKTASPRRKKPPRKAPT
jgi:DNA transformation protein